ncbi:hypothetical protein Pelo_3137 [Pelomyxa schiedti]|nr:hypothetical protein Pelo_3137 [Pelomyxa schiedti]
MGNTNSIAIDNNTPYMLHVVIMQVGPLFDAIVPCRSQKVIDCGARVWFTVAVSKTTTEDAEHVRITKGDVAKPIVLVTTGSLLAVAAAAGIVVGGVFAAPVIGEALVTVGAGAAVAKGSSAAAAAAPPLVAQIVVGAAVYGGAAGVALCGGGALGAAIGVAVSKHMDKATLTLGCLTSNCDLFLDYMKREGWEDVKGLQESFIAGCPPDISLQDVEEHVNHMKQLFESKGIEQSEVDELVKQAKYHFFDSCYKKLLIPDDEDATFRISVRRGRDTALANLSEDESLFLEETARELESIAEARNPRMMLLSIMNATIILARYWTKYNSKKGPFATDDLLEWLEKALYMTNIPNMHSILTYISRFGSPFPSDLNFMYVSLITAVQSIERRAKGGPLYKYIGIGTLPSYVAKYGVYANGKTTVHVNVDENDFLVLQTTQE